MLEDNYNEKYSDENGYDPRDEFVVISNLGTNEGIEDIYYDMVHNKNYKLLLDVVSQELKIPIMQLRTYYCAIAPLMQSTRQPYKVYDLIVYLEEDNSKSYFFVINVDSSWITTVGAVKK